jgi:nucleotide-binding universal stress UspA family protein
MYRKILLALDASNDSAPLIAAAGTVAQKNDAEVLVLNVEVAERVDTGVAEAASQQLHRMGVKARSSTMRDGHVAVLIVSTARSFAADLIVMGSRGLGELKAVLAGSVSRDAIVGTDCSVLLIKNNASAMKSAGRVLAAVESTEDEETIVPALLGLPRPSEVIVLHVPEMSRTFGEPPILVDYDTEAEAAVLTAVRKLREAGVPARARVAANLAVDVGNAIAREATLCEAQLIVVGSRRPRTLEGILVGSTARGVLQHANRPVLIAERPAAASGSQ